MKLWKPFIDYRLFNELPVAAIIDDKILLVHGGLSPELIFLKLLYKLKRSTNVPETGLLCDKL